MAGTDADTQEAIAARRAGDAATARDDVARALGRPRSAATIDDAVASLCAVRAGDQGEIDDRGHPIGQRRVQLEGITAVRIARGAVHAPRDMHRPQR
eukprot:5966539-Prymnesium_polylepis.1